MVEWASAQLPHREIRIAVATERVVLHDEALSVLDSSRAIQRISLEDLRISGEQGSKLNLGGVRRRVLRARPRNTRAVVEFELDDLGETAARADQPNALRIRSARRRRNPLRDISSRLHHRLVPDCVPAIPIVCPRLWRDCGGDTIDKVRQRFDNVARFLWRQQEKIAEVVSALVTQYEQTHHG
jgi:hypothetical protein